MAREMTPQERAEYAAANIYDVVKRFAYPYASIEKIVLRAVTETRRAALLEYREVIARELQLDHNNHPTRFKASIIEALDKADFELTRLVQEG